MTQDEIFKLLLIVLLISNEKANCTENTSSSFSSLNEIMIIVILFLSFNCNSNQNINDFEPINTTF